MHHWLTFKQHFRSFLTPPTFDEQNKTFQVRLLHPILLSMTGLLFLATFLIFLLAPADTQRFGFAALISFGLCLYLLWLERRGNVKAASRLLIAALWLLITALAGSGAGVRSPAFLSGYLSLIVVAGILLGGWGSVLIAGLSTAVGLLLLYGEATERWIPAPPIATPSHWAIAVFLFCVVVVVQRLSAHIRQEALNQAQTELRQRHQTEQALRESEERLMKELKERQTLIRQLEIQNEELERFTYTVSHDLKTPLITIRNFLGYLERDALAGNMTRFKTDLQRIDEASDQMRDLLDDLLELSRIGRLMNPPEHTLFATIVQTALRLVEGHITARAITVEMADNLPVVYGDRMRLVEVMQNLLDNAAKYMGEQSKPHIYIGVQAQKGELVFFVQDNGMGIAPHYHQKVFGLFEKLDPLSEGTGIGLALVKRIVEVHNGRIWVESAGLGQGSTFYFTLPLNDTADPPG